MTQEASETFVLESKNSMQDPENPKNLPEGYMSTITAGEKTFSRQLSCLKLTKESQGSALVSLHPC